MSLTSAPIDAQSVTGVLSEIAEIASETIELREVFDRVGTAVQRVIPFYKMGVVRIIDGSHVVLHAVTFTEEHSKQGHPDWKCSDAKSSDPMPVTAWSPRWRPHAGPTPRIDDAKRELDPSFLIDRLEALLGTLAQTLDVREVFEPLSEGMKVILPHDMMCLTELDMRARTIRISAISGKTDNPAPTEAVPLTESELERRNTFEIINDIAVEVPPDTERQRLIISSGMRSWLRVPVWISGQV